MGGVNLQVNDFQFGIGVSITIWSGDHCGNCFMANIWAMQMAKLAWA